MCGCVEHHPANPLENLLSGAHEQPCIAHRACHYPPLRTDDFQWEGAPVPLTTIWPPCCNRSLACQCGIINETSPVGRHLVEARVVREIIVAGNAAAQRNIQPNALRYFFNGEGANLDVVMAEQHNLGTVDDYGMNAVGLFSGAQIKVASDRAYQVCFGHLDGYGDDVLLVLCCIKTINRNPVQVFITITGAEATLLHGAGHTWNCPAVRMTALANAAPGAYTFNTPQGVAIRRVDMDGLLQRLQQHYLHAKLQQPFAAGALQTWFCINQPTSPTALVAYRAWVHLWLLYLKPAGFALSDPHVDCGHADHLLQWPDELDWYRVETVTFHDCRDDYSRREAFLAITARGGGRTGANHSSDYDFLLVHHAVGILGHPRSNVMPLNTWDFFLIPMYAVVDNEEAIIDELWVHPRPHIPVRGARTFGPGNFADNHRITIDQQRMNSLPAIPSFMLTIGNPDTERLHYNDPWRLFPHRSNHLASDWARQYRIKLPLPQMLLQGPAMDAAVHAFTLFTAMREFRL